MSTGVADLCARLTGLRSVLREPGESATALETCTTQLDALETECKFKRITKAQLSALIATAMMVEWPTMELRDKCVRIFTEAWVAGKANQEYVDFANYGTRRMWEYISENPDKCLEVLATLLEALQLRKASPATIKRIVIVWVMCSGGNVDHMVVAPPSAWTPYTDNVKSMLATFAGNPVHCRIDTLPASPVEFRQMHPELFDTILFASRYPTSPSRGSGL
jgi:hypothetical protein